MLDRLKIYLPLSFLSRLDVVLDKRLNLLLGLLQIVIKFWDTHTEL